MMVRSNSKIVIIFLSILFCFGCSKKQELNHENYLNYLNSEKSGLMIVKKLNGIKYTLKCQTPERQCLAFNKLKIKTQVDFEKCMKDYVDKLNFILLIEDVKEESNVVRKTVFDKEVYGSILGYSNDGLYQDINLETENASIPCGLVHLESSNSIQPILRMAILFTGLKKKDEEVTFVFNDNIFNNGPIKFNYSKDVFDQLPKLKIESI